jgi:hypothetical protein
MTSDIPTKKTVKAMDELLREKRQQMPSMSAMVHFERSFPRRLMAEVARPRGRGAKALKVVGWVTPAVFGAVAVVALGVAYFASPIRATARWEKAANMREYVLDALENDAPATSWQVEHALERPVETSVYPSANANAASMATRNLNHF